MHKFLSVQLSEFKKIHLDTSGNYPDQDIGHFQCRRQLLWVPSPLLSAKLTNFLSCSNKINNAILTSTLLSIYYIFKNMIAPSPWHVLWAAPLGRVMFLPWSVHTLPLRTPEKQYNEISGSGERLCRRHIRAEQSYLIETHCSHCHSKHLAWTIETNVQWTKKHNLPSDAH